MNVKNPTAAILLALCLVNAVSFAENVTDAPLVVNDPYATATDSNQSATPMKPHSDKKKKKDCPAQQTAQSKNKIEAQPNQVSSQASSSPTM